MVKIMHKCLCCYILNLTFLLLFCIPLCMIKKYSNLSNFEVIVDWIKNNSQKINEKDEDGVCLVDWILDGYRGKNIYKLELIEKIPSYVNFNIEQTNKIFYLLMAENNNSDIEKKIINILLKTPHKLNQQYQKELALTTGFLLRLKEIDKNRAQFIVDMQPNYMQLLEQININLISDVVLLNSLLILEELQNIYSICYDDCGTNGKEIMKKLDLFLLTDTNDTSIKIVEMIKKKNTFFKINKALKSKPNNWHLACLNKINKI